MSYTATPVWGLKSSSCGRSVLPSDDEGVVKFATLLCFFAATLIIRMKLEYRTGQRISGAVSGTRHAFCIVVFFALLRVRIVVSSS